MTHRQNKQEKQNTVFINNATQSIRKPTYLQKFTPTAISIALCQRQKEKELNNKGHFIRLRSSNSQITIYIPWDMRQLLPNRHRCCRKNLHICTTGRFVLVSLFIIMAHILRALYSCYPEENYGRLKGSCSCNAGYPPVTFS